MLADVFPRLLPVWAPGWRHHTDLCDRAPAVWRLMGACRYPWDAGWGC